ncbi:diacylglycerol kinase family protein [Parvularcula dongshanensis]|uniref:DAGKc domain-containing protein n=1 Tax=Parvularcula dongshanensis TaxID=1173995 RepID=A0A840I3D6_9PROT|nr:hypothetical protein [Parvularcula dongshanensis]
MLARVDLPGAARAVPDFGAIEAQIEGHDLIAVEGGDGTVLAVTTAVMRRVEAGAPAPRLILVPGGMTDLVARIAGAPREASVLTRLLTKGGRLRRLPVLRVEGAGDPLFGFFLAAGAVPRGIAYAREAIQSQGAEGSLQVAGAVAGIAWGEKGRRKAIMAPDATRADLDGETFGPDARFALVTTLPGLMVGLDPFWGREKAPIRVTLARGDSRHLRRRLVQLWLGMKPNRTAVDGYLSRNVHTLRLDTEAPLVLDGEDIPTGPLTVTSPRSLTVVMP